LSQRDGSVSRFLRRRSAEVERDFSSDQLVSVDGSTPRKE
jgi:hypothetical protein